MITDIGQACFANCGGVYNSKHLKNQYRTLYSSPDVLSILTFCV